MAFKLDGPIQSNGKDQLESFDLKLGAEGQGLSQIDGMRLISSGKNIFVEHKVGAEHTTRVTGVVDLSAALRDLRDMVRERGAGVDPELRALG